MSKKKHGNIDKIEILDGLYLEIEWINAGLSKKEHIDLNYSVISEDMFKSLKHIVNLISNQEEDNKAESMLTLEQNTNVLNNLISYQYVMTNLCKRSEILSSLIEDLKDFVDFNENQIKNIRETNKEVKIAHEDVKSKLENALNNRLRTSEKTIIEINNLTKIAKQKIQKLQKELQEEIKNDN